MNTDKPPPHMLLHCNVHLPSTWGSAGTSETGTSSASATGAAKRAAVVSQGERKSSRKKKKKTVNSETNHEMEEKKAVSARNQGMVDDLFDDETMQCDDLDSKGQLAAVNTTATSDHAVNKDGPPQSAKDACENILAAIQRCSAFACKHAAHEEIPSIQVNLDHILSRVPYKEMLKDLFASNASIVQHQQPSSGAVVVGAGTLTYRAPQIPVVSKAYEESFMRQAMFDYERDCVMGSQCECNFLCVDNAFTGVEFLLPSEAACRESAGNDSKRQMCVLCHRKMVQKLFYEMIYSGSPYR